MKRIILAVVAMGGLVAAGYAAGASARPERADRFFEMRTYYTNPGKMPALHARFKNHTTKLFEKHGMTNIGYWSPQDPKEASVKLVYLLAYPSKDAAKKS